MQYLKVKFEPLWIFIAVIFLIATNAMKTEKQSHKPKQHFNAY